MRGAVITREKDHGVEDNAVVDRARAGTIQPVWPHAIDLQLACKGQSRLFLSRSTSVCCATGKRLKHAAHMYTRWNLIEIQSQCVRKATWAMR